MKYKLFAHKNAANIQLFAETRKYFNKKRVCKLVFLNFYSFETLFINTIESFYTLFTVIQYVKDHSYLTAAYKKYCLSFYVKGVWPNPRKLKQKQYILKYALTHCQSFPFISGQTYFTMIDSSVNNMSFAYANRLSTDNRRKVTTQNTYMQIIAE